MRKLLFCVPMITLLLLAACKAGPAGASPAGASRAEELALAIRGEYLERTRWTANASISADYGRRVYQYELTASAGEGGLTLTLTAPETVAGITARLSGEDSTLEYDGLLLETGPLDGEGLTPLSALPALMEAARTGYITGCALEGDGALLRVDCGDPEGAPGTGREVSLWFDPATHALTRGEITVDGVRRVLCRLSDFTNG